MTDNPIDSLISTQVSSAADPAVAATAKRYRFSASQTRRLLVEADRCKNPGERGAFMRRERLYSSMLASWRGRSRPDAQNDARHELH